MRDFYIFHFFGQNLTQSLFLFDFFVSMFVLLSVCLSFLGCWWTQYHMNVFEDERASDGALDTNDFPSLIKGIGDGACSLCLSSFNCLSSFFFLYYISHSLYIFDFCFVVSCCHFSWSQEQELCFWLITIGRGR